MKTFKIKLESVNVSIYEGISITDSFSDAKMRVIVQEKLKEVGIKWDTANSLTYYNDSDTLYAEGIIRESLSD